MFQMPLDRITAVMGARAGLGETGQTYLVGSDGLMRSDSYTHSETHSVAASFRNSDTGQVDTEPLRAALDGNAGWMRTKNFAGEAVIAAHRRNSIPAITPRRRRGSTSRRLRENGTQLDESA